MPLVMIGIEEKFPVWWWKHNFHRGIPTAKSVIVVDIPKKTLAKWLRIKTKYTELQRELQILYKQIQEGELSEEHKFRDTR